MFPGLANAKHFSGDLYMGVIEMLSLSVVKISLSFCSLVDVVMMTSSGFMNIVLPYFLCYISMANFIPGINGLLLFDPLSLGDRAYDHCSQCKSWKKYPV